MLANQYVIGTEWYQHGGWFKTSNSNTSKDDQGTHRSNNAQDTQKNMHQTCGIQIFERTKRLLRQNPNKKPTP